MVGLRGADGEVRVTIKDDGELHFTDKMQEEAQKAAEEMRKQQQKDQ